MILIDAGNSRLKAEDWRQNQLQRSFSVCYSDGWTAVLRQWLRPGAEHALWYCSVIDAHRHALLEATIHASMRGPVKRCRAQRNAFGVQSGYEDFAQLGDDRWMSLLAARALGDRDCVIIDAGSALTLDLLRADGQHLGGAILPGVHTSETVFRQLFSRFKLEPTDFRQPQEPGRSTHTALFSDFQSAGFAPLKWLVDDWSRRLLVDPLLLLTGGDAAEVARQLDRPLRQMPDLVFRGIERVARA